MFPEAPGLERVFDFFKTHESFILTTHEGADADGLGAELVFNRILGNMGKHVRIFNAEKTASHFAFMDPQGNIEVWDGEKHAHVPEKSALLILDTSDEYHIGCMRDLLGRVRETFVVDHHEPSPFSLLSGFIDPTASSTCEMAVEAALAREITLDTDTAMAAFAGLSYDTGSFAYIKTTARTFRAALALIEWGAVPYSVYRELNESSSLGAVLLRKQVLSTLEIRAGGRAAVLILRKEDLESTGANFEDAETFINIPLRAREIAVSILVKENREGKVRCSLRSKGPVNVSKIAQQFGGGGHVTAAGFKSALSIEETLSRVLEKVESLLETV
ncbi:MAG: bifunctional oligoribonuclease/PAP phosphatase NrnA [Treponema sp.]|nr:bifunctional oligoribonuclease/PAP phosphatase NrnA [Treponema sp.]